MPSLREALLLAHNEAPIPPAVHLAHLAHGQRAPLPPIFQGPRMMTRLDKKVLAREPQASPTLTVFLQVGVLQASKESPKVFR